MAPKITDVQHRTRESEARPSASATVRHFGFLCSWNRDGYDLMTQHLQKEEALFSLGPTHFYAS